MILLLGRLCQTALNPNEWWHFDFRDWERYPILNLPFEDIGKR